MNPEAPQGDYVAQAPKSGLSRARKGIIGTMVLGAIVALAGAGTFASFSATTTNDGVFRSGRVILSNTVDGGTGACFSSGTAPGATATSDSNLDANETDCDDLFDTEIRLGDTATNYVTIANASDYDFGRLYLFGIDADDDTTNECAAQLADTNFSTRGSGNICDVVDLQIQEVASVGGAATGNYCVFPEQANNCNAFDDLIDFPAGYVDDAARTVVDLDQGQSKVFRIVVTAPDQAISATGWDQDNRYQNQRPNLKLRWLLVDTAS